MMSLMVINYNNILSCCYSFAKSSWIKKNVQPLTFICLDNKISHMDQLKFVYSGNSTHFVEISYSNAYKLKLWRKIFDFFKKGRTMFKELCVTFSVIFIKLREHENFQISIYNRIKVFWFFISLLQTVTREFSDEFLG